MWFPHKVKELMAPILPHSSNTKQYTEDNMPDTTVMVSGATRCWEFSPAGTVQSGVTAVVLLVHLMASLESRPHTLTVTLTCTLVERVVAHPLTMQEHTQQNRICT